MDPELEQDANYLLWATVRLQRDRSGITNLGKEDMLRYEIGHWIGLHDEYDEYKANRHLFKESKQMSTSTEQRSYGGSYLPRRRGEAASMSAQLRGARPVKESDDGEVRASPQDVITGYASIWGHELGSGLIPAAPSGSWDEDRDFELQADWAHLPIDVMVSVSSQSLLSPQADVTQTARDTSSESNLSTARAKVIIAHVEHLHRMSVRALFIYFVAFPVLLLALLEFVVLLIVEHVSLHPALSIFLGVTGGGLCVVAVAALITVHYGLREARRVK